MDRLCQRLACGRVCFKLLHCWCFANKTFSRRRAGPRLASAAPCGIGPWQCLHALGCHLLTPVSSMATRSWQVQLPCVVVHSSRQRTASGPAGVCHLGLCRWPGARAVCRWVRCCSCLPWLRCSLGALMQLQPPSPLGRQLQTHCRTIPQVVHLQLFAPPAWQVQPPTGGKLTLCPCAWRA